MRKLQAADIRQVEARKPLKNYLGLPEFEAQPVSNTRRRSCRSI